MRLISAFAIALALTALTAAPAAAESYAFDGNIYKGSPQTQRPGYGSGPGINPDGLGRQMFTGVSLGLDFMAMYDLKVTKLGMWDDNNDGITGVHKLQLWDLTTMVLLAEINTVPGGGSLHYDYRYFDLPSAVMVGAGDKISVVVHYTGGDSNGNSGKTTQMYEPTPTFTGGPLLTNIWIDAQTGKAARWGVGTGFPSNADWGPPNRYHAGSLAYKTIPEPGTVILLGTVLAVGYALRRRKAKLT